MHLLSKSKYIKGMQCHKYLWIHLNEPDKIPEQDALTLHKFEQGNIIGNLAKKLYKGTDIPTDDFQKNLELTKINLKKHKPLYEPGFLKNNIYARLDILNPIKDQWDIIEVKSSTEVKDVYIHDVSFQKHCCEISGLKIRKCFVAYINNQYKKKGKINPKKLFIIEDVTEKVNEAMKDIEKRIDLMLKISSAEKHPEIKIGQHCKDPYECSLKEHCWGFLPEHNIFELYMSGKRSFELYEKDILKIEDIPEDFKLSDKQKIQKISIKTKTPHINKEEIKNFLKELKYPLYYLDFETFSPVVPMFDGMRSYQRIPFQFSLHIVKNKKSKPEHFSFLAEGKQDPRKEFLEKLKKLLGNKGTIITYNQAFEQGVLKELSEAFPKNKKWLNNIIERMADLLIPFRSFHYYHHNQKGSASIKKVLPVLTTKDYKNMNIANGGDASLSYIDINFADISADERKKIRKDLEDYCGLDTEAMILLIEKLESLSK